MLTRYGLSVSGHHDLAFIGDHLGEVQLYFSCTLDKIKLNSNHYITMENYTILTLNTRLNSMAISTENSVLTLNKIILNDSQYGVLLFPVLTFNKMKTEYIMEVSMENYYFTSDKTE